MPRPPRGQHPTTQKLVAEDERLVALAKNYSWEKPKFQTPDGKALLEGLNPLFWTWADLRFEPTSRGHRNITLWINGAGCARSFEVTHTEASPSDSRHQSERTPPGYELWFDTQPWERRSKKSALTFPSLNRAILRSVALMVIADWEKRLLESINRDYN